MSSEPEYGAAEYLCFEVIRQVENRGREVPETAFNKLCALVYDELGDIGEVDLPHQWYQYGYVVNRSYLNDDFLVETHNTEWQRPGTMISVGGVSGEAFDVADEVKERVRSAATRLADKFQNRFRTDVIKNYSYEQQAPNEFILTMNEFRDELDELDAEGVAARDEHVPGVDISFTDATEIETDAADTEASSVNDEEISEYLRRLSRTFPEDTYTEMGPVFYQWRTLCKQLIRHDLYGELRNFQSAFWNSFSRVELRIRHSENIPPGQIRQWVEEQDDHIEEFNDEMAAKRQVVKNHREPTDRLSSVSAAYDESVEKINKRTEQ